MNATDQGGLTGYAFVGRQFNGDDDRRVALPEAVEFGEIGDGLVARLATNAGVASLHKSFAG